MAQVPLSDWSVMLNRSTGGSGGAQQVINSFKNNRLAGAITTHRAGYPNSMFRWDGQLPSAGVTPGAVGSNPTRATAGAVGQTNPTAPNKLYLVTAEANIKGAVSLNLCDRLMHMSALSATVTTPQLIAGGAVDRYTGDEAARHAKWLEIYTQIGATPTTVSASYTNQDGTPGQVTPLTTFGGTDFREVNRMIRLPFQQGDTGARSVESVTVTATTGTAGDFGVTIMRSILVLGASAATSGSERPLAFVPGPKEIKTDACLFWVLLAPAAVLSVGHEARLVFVQGMS